MILHKKHVILSMTLMSINLERYTVLKNSLFLFIFF